MKDFVVYEHISGMPTYTDTIIDEITDCAMEDCRTEEEVEKYIEKINRIQPMDKHGRKRNLYVYWH